MWKTFLPNKDWCIWVLSNFVWKRTGTHSGNILKSSVVMILLERSGRNNPLSLHSLQPLSASACTHRDKLQVNTEELGGTVGVLCYPCYKPTVYGRQKILTSTHMVLIVMSRLHFYISGLYNWMYADKLFLLPSINEGGKRRKENIITFLFYFSLEKAPTINNHDVDKHNYHPDST